MSTTQHVRAQLSAYLDGALGEAERLSVEGHISGCADCRARLGELRATARLIASLPDPVPSRRLVPRLAARPVWLAPLRTLTTFASGVSVFLFLATALLANVNFLASSGASTAAAPANVPAAAQAPSAQTGSAGPSARGAAAATSAPAPLSNADTSKAAASATPTRAAFSVTQTPSDASAAAESAQAPHPESSTGSPLGSSWLWLALAIVLGIIALGLQRRLRSA